MSFNNPGYSPFSALAEPSGASLVKNGTLTVAEDLALKATKSEVATNLKSIENVTALRIFEPQYDGQEINLLGHTVKGIGGGVFYMDYAGGESDDNGAVFVTAGGRRWKRKLNGYVTPEMFGIPLDGTDGSAVVVAAAALGVTLEINSGVFGVLQATTSNTLRMLVKSGATLKMLDQGAVGSSTQNIKTTGAGSSIVINGIIDGNNTGISGVSMECDDAFFYCKKAIGFSIKTDSATNVSVCRAVGNNAIVYGYGEQFNRNGISTAVNPNAPRMFSVEGASDNYYVPYSTTDGASGSLIIGSGTGEGVCDLISSRNAVDNALYLLGGKLTLGDIIHVDGNDECIVTKGDLTVTGTVKVRGYCIAPINLDNAGNTVVNAIDWDDEGARNGGGDYSGNIWRLRSGNIASGDLTIGTVKAVYEGNSLWGGLTGTMGRVTIGDGDVLFKARSANPDVSLSNFAKITAASSFNIGPLKVRVEDTDAAYTGSDRFEFANAAAISAQSFLDGFEMYPTLADGSIGPHQLRWRNAAQELVTTRGQNWTNAVSPPAIEQSSLADNSGVDTIETVPTSGVWNVGKRLMRRNVGAEVTPILKATEWQCITSGSPGSWVSISATVENV